LQIAEPAIVAAAGDTTVVTRFHPVEHALGGSGAPLMQFLDFVVFREIGPVLTLNIGGIANCQLADADRRRMMAFDTGPGNVMLDHAARVLLGKPYDADGAAAVRGKVDEALLSRLLEHDFFSPHSAPQRLAPRLRFGLVRTGTSPRTKACRPRTCSQRSWNSRRSPFRGPFAIASRSWTRSRP
jgi:anhydro-N-acetylmuramic acid kinase